MAGDISFRPHVFSRTQHPGRAVRLRRFAAVLALLWVFQTQAAPAATGYWTITGFLAGPVSAMDTAQAESFKGKRMFIDSATIEFDDAACAIVPTLTDHDAAAYFADGFRIAPQTLGHKAPKVFVIETGCDIPGLSSLILLDDGRMCFSRDGVFFFLSEELE
jgi:hypothetical protein